MIFDIGPFRFYRVPNSGVLDVSLKAFPDAGFGWEYGWEDVIADRKPWIVIRLGKLVLFQFEKFKNGFELWFLGFWWMK